MSLRNHCRGGRCNPSTLQIQCLHEWDVLAIWRSRGTCFEFAILSVQSTCHQQIDRVATGATAHKLRHPQYRREGSRTGRAVHRHFAEGRGARCDTRPRFQKVLWNTNG
ncbi:hypothetical protein FVE85_5813 [Porphyridium purpureum]|uniref:Uncharacterized protein n=1 Tax=Porphyridium purpureum TaxID=35688 RepID=A0A5J4Z4S9_PORPP|nr:hypothetical protein FVE85_5813 [Porphyridium purpureum]|eukprot:POR4461..scf295_1